jgi:hypothetical protein
MLSQLEQDFETDLTYWRNRVSSLEILVGELLAKNQAMRLVLESASPVAAKAILEQQHT